MIHKEDSLTRKWPRHSHTCLPRNCVFRNKNHQKPEHSIIFPNTSANVSPHLWNKSSYQILQENQTAIHCAPPLPIPCSWERCLLITLDCPPVQSFHNITMNFRVHASVIFLVNNGERLLLMVYFFKCLERFPFPSRWFCRCVINRLSHAFHHTCNIFTNGALIPICSAWSFAETSEKLLLLHVFCARAKHFRE